jgi:hypothetical protein
MTEGTDAHSIQRLRSLEKTDQHVHSCIGLGVDVEHRFWESLEKISQKRNWLSTIDERAAHLVDCHRRNVSVDATRAQQIRIVKGDEIAVLRQLDIGFEIAETDIEGSGKGCTRILGELFEPAAMSEGHE